MQFRGDSAKTMDRPMRFAQGGWTRHGRIMDPRPGGAIEHGAVQAWWLLAIAAPRAGSLAAERLAFAG